MSTGRGRLVVVCAVVALCVVGSPPAMPQEQLTDVLGISDESAFATGGPAVEIVDSSTDVAPSEVGASAEITVGSGVVTTNHFGSGDVGVAPLEDEVAVWDPAAAFFRSLEPACLAHAAEVGRPPVERERFSGARQVGEVDGSPLIEDGMGVRLVVLPATGFVLPDTAGDSDSIPPPYRDACPPGVFVGARR